MAKFFALVIMPDLSLKKVWMDNAGAVSTLKENEGAKVYRSTNDQEAILVDINGKQEVAWKDVEKDE